MKKLKEIWGRNKILIVLGIILLICVIAILIVTFSYFLGGSTSVYGDRLEGIEDYPISDEVESEYLSYFNDNEVVSEATFDLRGRIIYVYITFNGGTPLETAESLAAESLNLLTEDILSYYDINFTLVCEETDESEGYTILGARNVAGSGLTWNNNTPVESEE